tara:strand:- start:3940 stop:6033 length:2094 start_codon:yes stop_codon:yes gene_type:complete
MGKLSPRAMKPNLFQRKRDVKLNGFVEFSCLLPKPPAYYRIDGWDNHVSEQRWRIPDWVLSQVDYDSLELDAQIDYLKQVNRCRTDGYWFYNHGNIEYLTGDHFFYLAFWRIDGIVPYWKDSDATFFYIEKHCGILDDCLGWMQITNRRDGKTGKATATLYNNITLSYDAFGGIQSKTSADGKMIFRKLVRSWQKLPNYLKPTDSGDSNPSQSLRFEEPAKRSTKGARKVYKDVLNSAIDYKPSVAEAYDGSKLRYYYDDEYGKTTEVNVNERWQIVKECLVQGRNVVGKSLHTTTAEEMEDKGGAAAKEMWDDSDLIHARKEGRDFTVSGLLRWFKPATLGLEGFIDSYGYSVVKDPSKPVLGIDGKKIDIGSANYIDRRRKGMTGSRLAGEKRKYPLTIDEAFIEEGKLSPFDIIKLNDQISYNGTLNNNIITGNFIWIDRENNEVGFTPTDTGRWNVLYMPPVDLRNKTVNTPKGRKPGNMHYFVSGCDPFDHKVTTDNKKSNGASYIFRKLDPFDQEYSDTFVCEYVNRPATPDMFYEDMLKQSIFYGCELLCENNKIGLINWFDAQGYSGYLMSRPNSSHTQHSRSKQREKGIPMSGEAVRQRAIEITEAYVHENTGYDYETDSHGKVFFNDLLKCWVKFNPQKWTDYDEFVGAALCLFAKDSKERNRKKSTKDLGLDVGRFVKSYRRGRRL